MIASLLFLCLSAPPSAGALPESLDRLVRESALAGARVGVAVLSLDGGGVVYARDADALLNPASNVKLFTAAAALHRLGPGYRFETEIWTTGEGADGAVGALHVRGKGDPTWTTERLWSLAGEIGFHGVRLVRGDVVVDDRWFDAEPEAPGYEQEEGDHAYLAPAGAVSLNGNAFAVHLGPGPRPGARVRAEVEPASDFLELVNRAVTAKVGARRRVVVRSEPAGRRQRVTVEGRIPSGSRDLAVHRKVGDPAAYFGRTLRRFLELRGVKVRGGVRRGEVPPAARLLHVAESETLAEVVRRMNKGSSNFVAEQLVKVLGAEAKGPPGSFAKGVAAGEEALAELGLPRGAYLWRNGSGLNDANRFSAMQIARLLREMWLRFPLMPDFLSSLPVAGRDGTIRWRMEGSAADGRLRAKTGTLTAVGVAGLSGYVEGAQGERLAFAVLANDWAGHAGPVVRALDQAGALLAGGAAAGAQAAPAAPAAPAVEEAADERARVATWYRLGLAGDSRNARFLRLEARGEREPALRMAAAEAAFLAAPDVGAGRRLFLDAVAEGGTSLSRLRALAADLDLEAPVLGSLADIAGDGNGEALLLLLELGPSAMAEPGLARAWAGALDEVARDAPEETAAALRGAAPAVADAALAALAGALAAEGAEHPVAAALRAAAADSDETRAGPARELGRRLLERAAEARRARGERPAPEVRPGG
ncbi:MAG TPA: D-alanyl-D-alanine carboxypeptidase/D-alanyl-D-alanine-endopeptidase [Anaeromyxobacteraceae bacterium]